MQFLRHALEGEVRRAGSRPRRREFDDCKQLNIVLGSLMLSRNDVIIHGDAQGADRLAKHWAIDRSIPVEAYPADWALHGRSAGRFGTSACSSFSACSKSAVSEPTLGIIRRLVDLTAVVVGPGLSGSSRIATSKSEIARSQSPPKKEFQARLR